MLQRIVCNSSCLRLQPCLRLWGTTVSGSRNNKKERTNFFCTRNSISNDPEIKDVRCNCSEEKETTSNASRHRITKNMAEKKKKKKTKSHLCDVEGIHEDGREHGGPRRGQRPLPETRGGVGRRGSELRGWRRRRRRPQRGGRGIGLGRTGGGGGPVEVNSGGGRDPLRQAMPRATHHFQLHTSLSLSLSVRSTYNPRKEEMGGQKKGSKNWKKNEDPKLYKYSLV